MTKMTKRMRAIAEKVEVDKAYAIDEAVSLLNELSKTKFKESFDVSINLGIDPRKSDQGVRGATTLPHGTGKAVRVAVFAQGDNAEAATAAGADIVGFEDLAEEGGIPKTRFHPDSDASRQTPRQVGQDPIESGTGQARLSLRPVVVPGWIARGRQRQTTGYTRPA